MDKFYAEKYAAVFHLLAEILERAHPASEGRGISYALGDLARRVFVGTQYDPPDELLEEVAHAIRGGEAAERARVAERLRDHAEHLAEWPE